MKASLYLPGQPAQLLTYDQLEALRVGGMQANLTEQLAAKQAGLPVPASEYHLTIGDYAQAAALLGTPAKEVLTATRYVIIGAQDVAGHETTDSSEAELAVTRLIGDICEVYGPLLIIELEDRDRPMREAVQFATFEGEQFRGFSQTAVAGLDNRQLTPTQRARVENTRIIHGYKPDTFECWAKPVGPAGVQITK